MGCPADERFPRLHELEASLSCSWPAIGRASRAADADLAELERLILPAPDRSLAEDASLVVFGSLARGESTSKSDLDWVLLIDGQVDETHFRIFQEIRKKLKKAEKIEPGTTGTFGEMAFSHGLVHQIGGSDDTNRNLTLRMLLLLESISIGDDIPRQRVIKAILRRYVGDDPSWTWKSDGKIPRFLLNDVVRFWRTMAVDFADKFHDQIGEKWALRNAKLRFSRKLIFLAGMLACFSWQLHPPSTAIESSETPVGDVAVSHLINYLGRPPLEIIADELLLANAPGEICKKLFNSYDQFLAILDDEEKREELKTLPRDLADSSELFQSVRKLSHQFSDGLLEWLFRPDTQVFALVKDYGLF